MTFSQAIETLRDRAGDDIEHIVADYIELKRSGSGMKARCPFHDEKTPSFRVSAQKRMYKCFGCGVGGDVFDFIEKMEGLKFHEVIFKLADRYNMDIDNNSRDAYREKLQSNEHILPGITELKGQIRKTGNVFLALNEFGHKKEVDGPKFNLQGRVTDKQASLLRNYAECCTLLVRDLPWKTIKETFKTLLSAGFFVQVVDPSFIHIKTVDWLTYTQPEVGGLVSRKDIIELLAAIPDDLTRSTYTTEFSNYLNQQN